jgi:hypothetical protein
MGKLYKSNCIIDNELVRSMAEQNLDCIEIVKRDLAKQLVSEMDIMDLHRLFKFQSRAVEINNIEVEIRCEIE